MTIKEKIDKLCRDAWEVGRTEVKELYLFEEEAQALAQECSRVERYMGPVAYYTNPVTGAQIKINIQKRQTAFEKWYEHSTASCLMLNVQAKIGDTWVQSASTMKQWLEYAFDAGQKAAQEK